MGARWHRELYAAMYRPAWLMAWPLLFASSTAFLKIDPTMSPRYLNPFPAIADSLSNDPFTGGPRPPPDVLAPGLSRLLTQRAVQQQVLFIKYPKLFHREVSLATTRASPQ
jgi:hypothetical protein